MTRSDIILNVEDGSIISELTSTLTAPAQSFVFGDVIDLQITGVSKNEGSDAADRPWSPIDMTDKEFRVALGTTDRLPFAGSFTINSSSQIAPDASGATVETALNTDSTITSEGGVVVSLYQLSKKADGASRITLSGLKPRLLATIIRSCLARIFTRI